MISDALDALVLVESALTISSPIDLDVTKVYKYIPDPEMELPGPRVWQNEWTMGPVDTTREMAVRDLMFTVHLQFLAAPSTGDFPRSYEIASHFWEALVSALYPVGVDPETFRSAQSLNQTCSRVILRGGDPTVGLISRGGKGFIGAEGFLDIYMSEFWSS